MPIEIRELVIRATVDSNAGNAPAAGNTPAAAASGSDADTQKIADMIMDRIKNKNER